MKFRYQKLLGVFAFLIAAFFILFMLGRNSLLNYFMHKKLHTFETRFQTKIDVEQANFRGFTGLLFQNITLAPSTSDTLLHIDSVYFSLRIFPLVFGKIRFANLEITNTRAHFIKRSDRNNFSFLMKGKKEANPDSTSLKMDYSLVAQQLVNTIFDAIPASVNFKNNHIQLEKDSLNLLVNVPQLEVKNHEFNTQINFIENNELRSWIASGTIYSAEKTAELKIYPATKQEAEFPLLKQKWKLTLAFDTLQMNLSNVAYDNNELQLQGWIGAQNLKINQWRISPNKVTFKSQKIDFSIRIGTNFLALDSSSTITFNKIHYHPFVKFQIYPSRQLQLDAAMPECNSTDFFESLPEGLFENVEGIKTSGNINYRLHFFIDTKHPDELEFSSFLGKSKFKILAFGKTSLTKINSEFQYTAYEKDRAVRTFMVGPSNPNYTPITAISANLKAALLTSEDGNFYSHSGFNEDAFRKSIATNFKQKRFVRGGSTISMQLVKNVFLTRNKTIARKVEEALIVWLIENNRLSSKERMYEVYLNLIEWGPNVYGIGEASRFYFDKSPSELSLAESIFLAMIVPRPKGFKYNFGTDGKLKESTASYYNLVASHMVKKGVLTEKEKNSLIPNVELKGLAKNAVLISDTTSVQDETQEDDFIIDN